MEKKLYIKPETETLHMDCSQIMASSPLSIQKSDDPNDLEADEDGYYWTD